MTNPATLLHQLHEAGVKVTLDGSELVLIPGSRVPADLVPALRRHKAEIIALYEQGLDEVEIARQSGHAQSSAGRYIRDYERVKLLLKQDIPVTQISQLLGMQPSVVDAYVKLAYQYHPDLDPSTKLSA